MKRENLVPLLAVIFLCFFLVAIKLKGDSNTKIIQESLQLFDGQLDKFSYKAYKRIRPYINLLADHYTESVVAVKDSGLSETGKLLDESVKAYSLDRSDVNFEAICKVLDEKIRRSEREVDLGLQDGFV